MGAAHHQHGQTALADTAADGQGQLVIQQHLVEGQRPPVVAVGEGQLAVEGFRVHTDAHGGDLQRPVQRFIPEENVAVQIPVVIVGGAAVVGLAGAEKSADLHDAGSLMLPDKGVFPLGTGFQTGIHVFQLLRGDEGDLPAQLGAQLGEADVQAVVGVADGTHDGADDELQEVQIPVFPGNDLLPVPLIDVDGMDVVQRFVPADGVHVGVQAISNGEIVALEGEALPFCQRMHHLSVHAHGGNVKGHRPLVAVQVIVQAGAFGDEQGRGDALQVQRLGKFLLERLLDIGNGALGVVGVQHRLVVFGNVNFVHKTASFHGKQYASIVFFFSEKSRGIVLRYPCRKTSALEYWYGPLALPLGELSTKVTERVLRLVYPICPRFARPPLP